MNNTKSSENVFQENNLFSYRNLATSFMKLILNKMTSSVYDCVLPFEWCSNCLCVKFSDLSNIVTFSFVVPTFFHIVTQLRHHFTHHRFGFVSVLTFDISKNRTIQHIKRGAHFQYNIHLSANNQNYP